MPSEESKPPPLDKPLAPEVPPKPASDGNFLPVKGKPILALNSELPLRLFPDHALPLRRSRRVPAHGRVEILIRPFVESAARDPQVLPIKLTIYRTSERPFAHTRWTGEDDETAHTIFAFANGSTGRRACELSGPASHQISLCREVCMLALVFGSSHSGMNCYEIAGGCS
jgi:hypothetical protein